MQSRARPGVVAVPHESSSFGGDYWRLRLADGSEAMLFQNRGVYNDEPIADSGEWPIVLRFEESRPAVIESVVSHLQVPYGKIGS